MKRIVSFEEFTCDVCGCAFGGQTNLAKTVNLETHTFESLYFTVQVIPLTFGGTKSKDICPECIRKILMKGADNG